MSRSAVVKFIGALAIHFPRPKPDTDEDVSREKQWLEAMISVLGEYDEHVLQRAATRIVRSESKDRRFPLPAVCRKAAEEIIKLDAASATPRLDEKAHPLKDGADYRYRLADELICSAPIGKRAALEGWILSLHDFCRINGRLPTQDFEVRKCIDGARGFDEAYEAALNGKGGVCAKALEGLGDTMLKRRESLRTLVIGKEAA